MVQMKNVKWLKPEEFSTLFANLDDIVKLNSALLQHLLVPFFFLFFFFFFFFLDFIFYFIII